MNPEAEPSERHAPGFHQFPSFPKDFVFGAATASYQIEGAPAADGKSPSIWDTFTHTKGTIKTGETGDVACDHYAHMDEDVALMERLNLQAYRFSVSWPRVIPDGTGAVNVGGIDFYDRLVDRLMKADIQPFVTLYHWDLPQTLQDRGGWSNRDVARWFGDYTDAVLRRLGDRVNHWITLNEPNIFTMLGNLLGMHAPGYRNPWRYFTSAHNALRGHGEAVRVIRAHHADHHVGITINLSPVYPQRPTPKDRTAATTADQALNRFFLDPVLRGRYPPFAKKAGLYMPRVHPGDMAAIHEPIDFLGINNYSRTRVRTAPIPGIGFWSAAARTAEREEVRDGVQYTAMGWEVYPRGIHEVLTMIRDDYDNIPTYITENGAAYTDHVTPDGSVHDPLRMQYLQQYLTEVRRAISDGVDCRGYFVWTLMDNFEWAEGYSKRFGIVYTDFPTGRRTIKASGHWYAALLEKHRNQD